MTEQRRIPSTDTTLRYWLMWLVASRSLLSSKLLVHGSPMLQESTCIGNGSVRAGAGLVILSRSVTSTIRVLGNGGASTLTDRCYL